MVFERHGRLLHLGPVTLAYAETILHRSGWRGTLLGRPIAAGVFGVPFVQFLPAVAVGGLLYILAFDALAYFVGSAPLDACERIGPQTGALLALAAVTLLVFMFCNAKREVPAVAHGAAVATRLDGLLAGVIVLLATNGLIGVAAFAARPLGADELGTGLRFLLEEPVFLDRQLPQGGR